MPRIARAVVDNQIYHVINRGNRREEIVGSRRLAGSLNVYGGVNMGKILTIIYESMKFIKVLTV